MALSRGGKGGRAGAEIQRLYVCLNASLGSGRLKKLGKWMDVTGKGNNHFLCPEMFWSALMQISQASVRLTLPFSFPGWLQWYQQVCCPVYHDLLTASVGWFPVPECSEGTQSQGRAKDGNIFFGSWDWYSDGYNQRIIGCELFITDWCLVTKRLGLGNVSNNDLVCCVLLGLVCLF